MKKLLLLGSVLFIASCSSADKDIYDSMESTSSKNKEIQEDIDNELDYISALKISCDVDQNMCMVKGFAINGRNPGEEEKAGLKKFVEVLNDVGENGGEVRLVGHTDSTDTEEWNKYLSEVRAQNLANLLKEYGLNENIVIGSITGEGELKPIDTNQTKEGRYNNRRVEMYFDNFEWDKMDK